MIATILITGGAGNIGSAIANKLAEDSNTFVVVYKTKLDTQQF